MRSTPVLPALLGLALLGSCAGRGKLPQAPAPGAAAHALPAELAELNRKARTSGITESLHGINVEDPYRALEQRSELTDAWIDAQTAHTTRSLAPFASKTRKERLHTLLSIGSVGDVAVGGERIFALLREGQRQQPALFQLEPRQQAPLLDPLEHGERAAIDFIYPAPNGQRIALGLSHNGDERSVLHVLDVERRELLAEAIEHAKWSSVAWLSDSSGFYYTRYPAEGEPHYDAVSPDTYFPLVLFHHVGDDPRRDTVVLRSAAATDFPFVALSDDDRYVVFHNHRSWTAIDVQLLDRGQEPKARVFAPDAAHPLQPVVVGLENQTSGTVHKGQLYLLTNIDADRKRIVRVPVERAGDTRAWTEVVGQSQGTIDGWAIAGDRVVVHTVTGLRSHLSMRGLDGQPFVELPLPTEGSIESLTADPHSGVLAFSLSSYFFPPAVLGIAKGSALAAQPRLVHQVEHDLDPSALELSHVQTRSADGTAVSLQLVHRRGLPRDGNSPVLLTGYGGFNVSLLPELSRNALYFIERGGVYAVANLRGGGEHGESWHRAGMLEHKHHVFEDFEAALRYLSTSGISQPSRIAIVGGSNGGLLIAAMATRSPELFAAGVAQVGLYDMLRYHLFPPAEIWTSEYSDPRDPSAARFLHAYSPYHRVANGTRYPAMLIETADHDTRVHWAHSTKFAARMQEAQAADRPVYFYMERKQGHGAGARLSDLVSRYDRIYAFIESQLRMP